MKMAGIGVNLRVTGHCNQGGRKYMEDMFSVAYQQTVDLKDLEYAFFGIFDGHGGPQAATFAKENLLDFIVNQRNFWSDNDEDVLRAIREGFISTHYAMWKDLGKWPKTGTGLPSTSGTTATIAFIMKGKIYYGHVGDTAIVLGYQEKGDPKWKARVLTKDHKPEYKEEIARIHRAGGKVVAKSGVPRVVWNRPRLGHQGPVRRSTLIDEIPFLAVARSLGDFWSYNSQLDQFVVSPEPDVGVYTVDVSQHKCLIFGTDGLWNMLDPERAINIVHRTEVHNEKQVIYNASHASSYNQQWINPSKNLVDRALERWIQTKQRADNTSVVTLMLDPPGPPRAQVLLNQKQKLQAPVVTGQKVDIPNSGGVAIFTRFPGGLTTQHSPSSIDSNPNNGISADTSKTVVGNRKLKNANASETLSKKSDSSSDSSELLNVESRSLTSDLRINQTLDPNHSPLKRRTRSEDKPLCEEGSSDAENERLGWPIDCWGSDGKKRRINSEKKVNKARTWRRSSVSSVGKVHELCKSRSLEETTRMLRSDTQAALPIKTLRSRNVDLRRSTQNNDSFYNSVNSINSEVKLDNGAVGGMRGKRTPGKYSRPSSGQSSTNKRPPQWSQQAMTTRSHGNKSLNS